MLGFMEEVDRQEEQDEDEETVTFTRMSVLQPVGFRWCVLLPVDFQHCPQDNK
jgi:hypothetical protein